MEKICGQKGMFDASKKGVTPDVLIEYLKGAKIGFNQDKLLNDLKDYDEKGNKDGLIQKDEFINCFTHTQSISDCLWIDTDDFQSWPHPDKVAALFPKDSPKRIITQQQIEQM